DGGTANFNPSLNPLVVSIGAQILNSSTFNIQNGNTLGITTNGLGGVLFSNGGTVNKTGAGSPVPINIPFNNDNVVNINAGTLQLNGGGASGNPSTFNATGNLQWNGGTYTLNQGTNLNGTGIYLLDNANLVVNSALLNVPNFQQGTTSPGTLSLAGGK